jgi:hypothetical protein
MEEMRWVLSVFFGGLMVLVFLVGAIGWLIGKVWGPK